MKRFAQPLWAALSILIAAAPLAADDALFPPDAGIVNVKDYGAKGDGVTDDTAAIQKALSQHPNQGSIIYLPAGTYLISDTLRWPHGSRGGMEEKNTILQGQDRHKTILKLADRCPRFADPKRPQAMLWTGQKPAQRFRNAVRDLTLDTAVHNPGAIGMQFMANNQGCVRDVTIRSGDGAGPIGLDMRYTDEIGPLLIKAVRIVGFDVGIATGHVVDSMVMEDVQLEGQRLAGFRNDGQCVSVRRLTSRNAVPAVENVSGVGLLTLIDCQFTGIDSAHETAAVRNAGHMLVRNLKTQGYARALEGKDAPAGADVAEWVSSQPLKLFDSKLTTLGLPARETPSVPWDEPGDWISPLAFGGKPDDDQDDTQAIQKAIDAAKPTVYLPRGQWQIGGELVVRGPVRRIVGCEAALRSKAATIRIDPAGSEVVVLERLRFSYSPIKILHESPRTLVISSCTIAAYQGSRGDLFLEDVCGGPFVFSQQNVWARQLNAESPSTKITSTATNLWILGYKTERGGTLIDTRKGRTELLGGFAYATSGPKTDPMFSSTDAQVSYCIGESCFNNNPFIQLVSETRGQETRVLDRKQAPHRTGGCVLPLYVGWPAAPAEPAR